MASFMISGVIKFLDEATPTISRVDDALKGLQERNEKLQSGLDKMAPAFKAVALSGAAVGVGIGYAVKQAADFESALAAMHATNQASTKEINALGQAAITLSSNTKFAANDILTGVTALIKTGASADDATKAMKPLSNAAKLAGTDFQTMSKLVSDATEALGKPFSEMPKLTDQIVRAARDSTVGIDQMATALANAGGIADRMDFSQMTASLGVLIDKGYDGGSAAGALTLALNQMLQPSDDVAKVFGGMDKTVAQFVDASGKMKPIPTIVKSIQKALAAQGNELQRTQFLTDLLGKQGPKMFKILNEAVNSGDFTKITNGLKEADGSAAEFAHNVPTTLNGVMKQFMNNVNNIVVQLGSMPLPVITEMFQKFTTVLQTGVLALQGFLGTGEKTPAMIEAMASPVGQFLKGFIEGSKEMIVQVQNIAGAFMKFFSIFQPGLENSAAGWGSLAAKTAGWLAIAAPTLVALGAMKNTMGGIIGVGQGMFSIFASIVPELGTFTAASQTAARAVQILGIYQKGSITLSTALMGIFPTLATATTLFTSAITLAGTAFRFLSTLLLTNPWAIALVTIPLLIAGIVWLVKNWDMVSATMVNFGKVAWSVLKTIGGYIFDFLLFPIRAVLTPLSEMIGLLASTSLGSKALMKLGIDPKSVTDLANKVSIVPSFGNSAPPDLTQAAAASNTQQLNQSAAVSDGAAANAGLLAPSTTAPLAPNINVSQAPINANFTIPVQIDGREIARAVGKQSVENAERRGTIISSQQKNSIMSNGGSAVSSGAQ